MKEDRIRGWIGEQSFELAQGHTKHIAAFVEAQVFSAVYRIHKDQLNSSPDAREAARLAVLEFRKLHGTTPELSAEQP